MTDQAPPTDTELARLADGSLPEAERESLRARVEQSPELARQLHEQQRAITLVQSTSDVVAPASLRASIDGLVSPARPRPAARRWRVPRLVPAAGGAALVAAVVVVLVLVTGGSSAPTVNQTARLALAPATGPAPAVNSEDTDLLRVRVGAVPFPSYDKAAGLKATGARIDSLSGRRVTTVFYRARGGVRVGYSVVAGAALSQPSGRAITVGGVRYVLRSVGSAKLVTWRRDGHTCVIAGHAVGDRMLITLAADDEQLD